MAELLATLAALALANDEEQRKSVLFLTTFGKTLSSDGQVRTSGSIGPSLSSIKGSSSSKSNDNNGIIRTNSDSTRSFISESFVSDGKSGVGTGVHFSSGNTDSNIPFGQTDSRRNIGNVNNDIHLRNTGVTISTGITKSKKPFENTSENVKSGKHSPINLGNNDGRVTSGNTEEEFGVIANNGRIKHGNDITLKIQNGQHNHNIQINSHGNGDIISISNNGGFHQHDNVGTVNSNNNIYNAQRSPDTGTGLPINLNKKLYKLTNLGKRVSGNNQNIGSSLGRSTEQPKGQDRFPSIAKVLNSSKDQMSLLLNASDKPHHKSKDSVHPHFQSSSNNGGKINYNKRKPNPSYESGTDSHTFNSLGQSIPSVLTVKKGDNTQNFHSHIHENQNIGQINDFVNIGVLGHSRLSDVSDGQVSLFISNHSVKDHDLIRNAGNKQGDGFPYLRGSINTWPFGIRNESFGFGSDTSNTHGSSYIESNHFNSAFPKSIKNIQITPVGSSDISELNYTTFRFNTANSNRLRNSLQVPSGHSINQPEQYDGNAGAQHKKSFEETKESPNKETIHDKSYIKKLYSDVNAKSIELFGNNYGTITPSINDGSSIFNISNHTSVANTNRHHASFKGSNSPGDLKGHRGMDIKGNGVYFNSHPFSYGQRNIDNHNINKGTYGTNSEGVIPFTSYNNNNSKPKHKNNYKGNINSVSTFPNQIGNADIFSNVSGHHNSFNSGRTQYITGGRTSDISRKNHLNQHTINNNRLPSNDDLSTNSYTNSDKLSVKGHVDRTYINNNSYNRIQSEVIGHNKKEISQKVEVFKDFNDFIKINRIKGLARGNNGHNVKTQNNNNNVFNKSDKSRDPHKNKNIHFIHSRGGFPQGLNFTKNKEHTRKESPSHFKVNQKQFITPNRDKSSFHSANFNHNMNVVSIIKNTGNLGSYNSALSGQHLPSHTTVPKVTRPTLTSPRKGKALSFQNRNINKDPLLSYKNIHGVSLPDSSIIPLQPHSSNRDHTKKPFLGTKDITGDPLAGGNDLLLIHTSSAYKSIPGTPGVDYLALTSLPLTGFDCSSRLPGYYADASAQGGCQVIIILSLLVTIPNTKA
ncbi:hypothetical protein SK128_014884 [Halocaridina rubra]|uniref:Uncharacterized protein n=1 Tax=Halocaridina rubra TaxID=373956 RepID=A0AAN8X2E6_HALRR